MGTFANLSVVSAYLSVYTTHNIVLIFKLHNLDFDPSAVTSAAWTTCVARSCTYVVYAVVATTSGLKGRLQQRFTPLLNGDDGLYLMSIDALLPPAIKMECHQYAPNTVHC